MKLSEKIWRLRESQNMSQEELAERLDVSRQTVSNWENDKAVLDAEKLAKLCVVFGVSADDMLSEDDDLPSTKRNTQIVSGKKRSNSRTLLAIILSIVALALIVIASVGLIVGNDEVSISSLITLHSSYVWIMLLVLGGAALVCALVALLKKK